MSNTRVASEGSRAVDLLDSLLLADTTDEVRDLYHRLEADAKTKSFGPLEDGVVVLDTETTGLSFRDCELIEIAAARLEGRKVVERFQTFVHPGGPIPKAIQRLTNITDLDVMSAPSPSEAVSMLAEFVGGSPVLAHNATFDRTFIEKVPGGSDVSDFWIDTLALSRIALPRLSSHRLADMAHAFHCDSVTHRAADDVDALCGMWRIILCGLDALPDGLLAHLSDMHAEVEWSFRPVFSYLASSKEDVRFDLRTIRRELISRYPVEIRKDARSIGDLTSPTRQEVEAYFAPGGPIAQVYDSYEPRQDQVKMALDVRDAFATSTHRAIEAGTGVGKSVAYLVPEALFAQRNRITVGVATKTNALADQLMTHELPAVSQAIQGGISYYILKGYEHYPCLLRMDHSSQDEWSEDHADQSASSATGDGADKLTALAVAYAFACQSVDGDLDALGIRWKVVPRDMLTINAAGCQRMHCPYFPNECFVHGARRRAASADVVVTNHSLLLRDIKSDNGLLPPIRHWVVDEAHGFEDEARNQWAVEVSGDEARLVFGTLGDSSTGLLHSCITRAVGTEAATLVVGLLSKAAASTKRARTSTEEFLAGLHDLNKLVRGKGEYASSTLWIDDTVRNTEVWGKLVGAGKTCIERLDACSKDLDAARAALQGTDARLSGEMAGQVRRVRALHDAMVLILEDRDPAYVYSALLYRQKRRRGSEKLLAQRLEIGEPLESEWLTEMESVVFTSATLSVGSSFEHFDRSVGFNLLPDELHKEVSLQSSFDFDKNMAVVVAEDMPQPNERGYLSELTDLLYDVHVAMGGSVLTLFTNRHEMESVFRELSPMLEAKGLHLICQDRGSSARRIRERFVGESSTSLFALKSFWEGFDAVGDTLRCVVIPKLPFASPQDPLVRERDARDRRAWWKYSLPDAVISVKQAAGRLIRSSSDTGVLVLADSRVAKKRYGKQVLDSLPSHNRIMLSRQNVGRYIQMWRESKAH